MLVYKAQLVVSATMEEPKDWAMNGRTGTTHAARLAVVGQKSDTANIRLKAKSAEELKSKVAKYTVGKPAEIEINEIIPVFRSGDRKAATYEYSA